MEYEERIKLCKSCINRKNDSQYGLVCSITGTSRYFNNICKDYVSDNLSREKRKESRGLVEQGELKLKFVFGVLFSISTLNAIVSIILPERIDQGLTPLFFVKLAFLLFIMINVYQKVRWAKLVLIGMCVFSLLKWFFSVPQLIGDSLGISFVAFIDLGVLLYLIYFLLLDEKFLAYFNSEKEDI